MRETGLTSARQRRAFNAAVAGGGKHAPAHRVYSSCVVTLSLHNGLLAYQTTTSVQVPPRPNRDELAAWLLDVLARQIQSPADADTVQRAA